jgi:phosphoribosylanthranilate isomerase
VRIKICGITNLEDARAAVDLGADALGFVFAESPRRISPEEARNITNQLPPFVAKVGVFVNAPLTHLRRVRDYCGLDAVQLHGEEDADYIQALGPSVIKALRLNGKPPAELPKAVLLLDAHDPKLRGGTGKLCDWKLASELAQSRLVILAGGLGPNNVEQAIRQVKPYAVDVSSGVEKKPGRKDHDKIASFIDNARSAASSSN